MAFEDVNALLRTLYHPPKDEFSPVDVPNLPFAMLDGAGDPNGEDYTAGLKWLFASIQPIRRAAKNRMGKDFIEPPLETLWWADDMRDLVEGHRDKLKWRLMIPLPYWIEARAFTDAIVETEKRLGQTAPKSLRMEWFEEGACIHIMHFGANDKVGPTLERLYRQYLPDHGLKPNGYYHEIYLSDPKRTAVGKRKTVLRQPVAKVD